LKKIIYKNMNRLFIKISVVLVTFLNFYSCNSTEPDDKITLSTVDASCTEVWLQITGEAGKEIQLIRDDKEIEKFTLTEKEKVVVDDSLLPNKTYTYQVYRNNGQSDIISVTTLNGILLKL
jgi:flagellar hook assembly protein FlgD